MSALNESKQSSSVEPSAETALQRAHVEVLAKRKRDKARIAELEIEVQGARATISDLTVTRPLRGLAAQISTAPEAFVEAFLKDHKVELQEGQLAVLNADGTPAMHEGKTVAFEAEALKTYLLSTKDEAKARLYNSIVIATKASGGGAVGGGRRDPLGSHTIRDKVSSFGLRSSALH